MPALVVLLFGGSLKGPRSFETIFFSVLTTDIHIRFWGRGFIGTSLSVSVCESTIKVALCRISRLEGSSLHCFLLSWYTKRCTYFMTNERVQADFYNFLVFQQMCDTMPSAKHVKSVPAFSEGRTFVRLVDCWCVAESKKRK